MSAPRSDGGGSAIWGLRAVRGPASHKHSNPKWQRAKALGTDNRVLLVLVLIYDCLFNRSSFKGVTLPMRHPKSSLINYNELIIRIEIYVLLKSDEFRRIVFITRKGFLYCYSRMRNILTKYLLIFA